MFAIPSSRSVVAAAALCSFVGCATSVTTPPEIPPIVRTPVRVGLHISDTVRNQRHSIGGTSFEVGRYVVQETAKAHAAGYESHTDITRFPWKPPDAAGLDIVIVVDKPIDIQSNMIGLGPAWDVIAESTITLYRPDGSRIEDLSAKSAMRMSVPVPPDFAVINEAQRLITESVVSKLMREVAGSAGVRAIARAREPTAARSDDRGWRPRSPDDKPESVRTGRLHVLCIGVSDYRDSRFDLQYAHSDARALADAFKARCDGVFKQIDVVTLIDAQATRDRIIEELAALKRNSVQGDLVIVAVAGHGGQDDDGNFHFLPHDFDESRRASSGVYWDDFRRNLNLPCPAWLIMDTCHSGAVTKSLRGGGSDAVLDREIRDAVKRFKGVEGGIVVTAACTAQQQARESPDWKHGGLSLALLEFLQGRRLVQTASATAELPAADGRVLSLQDTQDYIVRRVAELAGGRQHVINNQSGNIAVQNIPITTRRK